MEQLEAAVIHILQEALRFGRVVVITNAEAGWVELSGRRFLPRVVAFLAAHDIKIVSARTSFESDFPDAPSSWKMAAFSQEVAGMCPFREEDEGEEEGPGEVMKDEDGGSSKKMRYATSSKRCRKLGKGHGDNNNNMGKDDGHQEEGRRKSTRRATDMEDEEEEEEEQMLNVLVLGDSMSERDAAHALSTRLPNSRVKTVKFVERPSIDQLMRQVQLVAQSLPDLATYASSFDVDLVVSASG